MTVASLSSTSSQSSRHSTSTRSRTSSPRKQLCTAERAATGFVEQKFSLSRKTLPPSLAAVLGKLEAINAGVGILPTEAQDKLAQFNMPTYSFTDQPPSTRYAEPELVARILNRAAACDLSREGESSWNVEVHHPILSWVCRPGEVEGLVDFRYCTSATALSRYQPKPKGMPSRMVDFCMTIVPATGSLENQTINAISDSRPGGSINHTDWGSFTQNPIAVSIETKCSTMEEQKKAILQMGIWHACQWRNLRELAEGRSLEGLAFLPGILVFGQEWFFVASVQGPSGQSVLLTKQAIGTTEKAAGIYSILAAVDVLRAWAADQFWPSFKKTILGLS
ncbi:hypothetical protein DHEL01_v206368 [Diaporthe helianthi]|uniref:PD-(D/E)XK nuclease-like domain-containing protein n=1 Tax=Diaporthe helianthi TaxID=158607 RepID=A0A2P5HYB6_DIAHE|nr:hypothetical protein DHEL01_v206368 [Diaporthe helianthi]